MGISKFRKNFAPISPTPTQHLPENVSKTYGGAFPGAPFCFGRHGQAPSHHRKANPVTGTAKRIQQHPTERPIFRCRPLRDSGIPIWRDSFAWAWETPKARLQEKERPGMPVPRLRAMRSPGDVRILLLRVRYTDDPPKDHAGEGR